VREISWTKNLVILERCQDSAERQFYLERTKQFGWTKNVLIHQIENKTYEKTLLNQTNFDAVLPEHIRSQAKLAVKDEYTFGFLELADEHSERQLEQAILRCLEVQLNTKTIKCGTVMWKLPLPSTVCYKTCFQT
jgi:predicted nuclease of restriction endonuclease-like (RecB) superfamily